MTEIRTSLSRDLEIANLKAQYDHNVKNILSNKIILAWILKYAVNEFVDEPVEKIMGLIEGEPVIAAVPIYSSQSNILSKIIGVNTEDKVPNEGVVTYNIKFVVYTPSGERTKLIINIEAQKEFYTKYDLVTRGVFYGARMLSAQMDIEFKGDDYDSIKKVYSIWICMNSPKYAQNTITSYKMFQNKIYGNYLGKARFDIIEVIMVCLGKSEDKNGSQLIDMLNILLSDKLSVEDNKRTLSDKFAISSTVKLDKEMRLMCNLSDLVEERGIERGIERGKNYGESSRLISIVDTFVNKNDVTLEQALDILSVPVMEYEEARLITSEWDNGTGSK